MNESTLSDNSIMYLSEYEKILDRMIEDMTGAELEDSVSQNFIVQMIPHHRAAVEISENLLKYTTLVSLQNIAKEIIDEQNRSIAELEAALGICSQSKSSQEELNVYRRSFENITETMFNDMRKAPRNNDINKDYINEMIPLEEGGIKLARNAFRFPICSALDPILNAIIVEQEDSVRRMKQILRYL